MRVSLLIPLVSVIDVGSQSFFKFVGQEVPLSIGITNSNGCTFLKAIGCSSDGPCQILNFKVVRKTIQSSSEFIV